MTCYKIVVAYDGTRYHGWQSQPDATTICQVLEKSFFKVFSHKVSIVGASRTDAGVHAIGQVAVVRSKIFIPLSKLKYAWNNVLPEDISIRVISLLDKLCHPHDGVVQKTYWYHFFINSPLPFLVKYGLYVPQEVDLDLLQKALNVFVGRHDFRSFCTGDDMNDTIRTVDSAEVLYVKEYDAYRIVIKGKGFLRYMVRRIVGACLKAATDKSVSLEDLKRVLQSKNPRNTLPNAPAKGLVLYNILYKNNGEKGI